MSFQGHESGIHAASTGVGPTDGHGSLVTRMSWEHRSTMGPG